MMEVSKAHWEKSLAANKELIIANLMQIEMAKRVIELCEEKIKEFPLSDENI